MKNMLKDLPQKDMEAMIRGANMVHGSPTRNAFWDKVDELLTQMESKKAPKIEPRLTNPPHRGT